MQRDSDTADSGEARIVLYCVKRSLNKYVAVLPHPQVRKIHFYCETMINTHE